MKFKTGVKIFTLFCIILYVLLIAIPVWQKQNLDPHVINDVSRLNPTRVVRVVQNDELMGLQAALAQATQENLKVSIAGKRHSMGGHAFYKNAVVLDMTTYNKILSIDPAAKIVTVQSGATWKEVIEYVNRYNLSVQVMQAYNVFTIGGSMSVNVHESDPRFGPMVESVESFRLLLANGSVVNVSREENSELFNLVNGGYGLFGVILDVDLKLVDNEVYQKSEDLVSYKEYYPHFKNVTSNVTVEHVFARLSIAHDDTFLRDVVVTNYRLSNASYNEYLPLEKSSVGFKKKVFDLSRKYDYGKQLRWYLQRRHSDLVDPQVISRNNLMNGDVTYLDYNNKENTDILQEYFMPVEAMPEFVDDLRKIVDENDLNLLSATIRYVPRNNESVLSYSMPEESFGVVLYFNVGTSESNQVQVRRWTGDLLESSLAKGGTYYLPYKLYASQDQFERAYPSSEYFFDAKRRYDPQELFTNTFYETYGKN